MSQIFISHSSRDEPYAELVRDAVKELLEGRGHTVWLDKARLEPGDEWRSVLYQWLAECDGAVVLLSERALKSSWVRQEATILLWRRALGASVYIVPALLGEVRSTTEQESWLRDLLALQAARNPSAGTDETDARALAERIAERIGDVSAFPPADAPLGKWLLDVADCLGNVSSRERRLANVARQLKVRDEDWKQALTPGAEPFLAEQLLARPLDRKVVEAVADLARGLSSEWLKRLVGLVSSTWVDAEAARQLVSSGPPGISSDAPFTPQPGGAPSSQDEPWIIGINAEYEGTIDRYVERATCCANLGYPRCTPSGVYGEDVNNELLKECEAGIRKKLGVRGTRPVDERDFDSDWAKRVFLVFNPRIAELARVAEVARVLHAKYPRLTILMGTGAQLPSPADLATWMVPELYVLEPRLGGDQERFGDQHSAHLEGLVEPDASPQAGVA